MYLFHLFQEVSWLATSGESEEDEGAEKSTQAFPARCSEDDPDFHATRHSGFQATSSGPQGATLGAG